MAVLSSEDRDFWNENGYVVLHEAVPPENLKACEEAIWEFLEMDADDPNTWYPHPPRPQIMVEIYQHQALWDNRQYPRIHQAYSELRGTEKLWVSFDRASMSPPIRPPDYVPSMVGPMALHWDISSLLPPYRMIQGVLYLTDTAANQGAFTCVPGFHRRLESWVKSLPPDADPRKQDIMSLGAEPIPGKAGDLIIWSGALPHGAGLNTADRPRLVQYITMHLAQEEDEEARVQRIHAWRNRLAGTGGNSDLSRNEKEHDTGRTAKLTPLGRKLLGLDRWNDKMRAEA